VFASMTNTRELEEFPIIEGFRLELGYSFRREAFRRAECSLYSSALGQREIDWAEVAIWADRVRELGFRWLHESEQYGSAYIILGANFATASGQHRILGGLM